MSFNDASCWICLEEGLDEAGQPLQRDCSCRGDAGFSHFKCLVHYAEKKSAEVDRLIDEGHATNGDDFTKPWRRCPNCDQLYQDQLSLDLMDSLMEFTKKTFPCDAIYECPEIPCEPTRYVEVLTAKLFTVSAFRLRIDAISEVLYRRKWRAIAEEGLVVINKVRSQVIDLCGGDFLSKRIVQSEATFYETIGMSIAEDILDKLNNQDDGYKFAMKNLQKSLHLFKSIGDDLGVMSVETKIAQFKSWCRRGDMKESIEALYERYHEDPLNSYHNLVGALEGEFRLIECQRIIADCLAMSRRIHGPTHNVTNQLEDKSQSSHFKSRRVALKGRESDQEVYEILRYEEDGAKCVLWGPFIKGPKHIEEKEKKTLIVDTEMIYILHGNPVVCHGLRNASHLNGEIGEIRSLAECRNGRLVVHFEEKSLKPCLVKPENLRIVFDLPPKSQA